MTKYWVYVGTYSERGSRGIYRCLFDADAGKLSSSNLVAEGVNLSYLALDAEQSFLYAVSETSDYNRQASGSIKAYEIDGAGELLALNEISSHGAGPCYISFDKSGEFLLAANFHGGTIGVFRILQDGRLGDATAVVRHRGSGADPSRQKTPHPHAVETSPDNHLLIAADLGLDKLAIYPFSQRTGSIASTSASTVKLHDRAGPRHFVFHPRGPFVYVANEIDSTVTIYLFSSTSGFFHEVQTISTLPKEFSGSSDAAGIKFAPAANFLYVSNRGHDTIAVFAVDPQKGELSLVSHASSAGKTPRSFIIDPTGRFLLVANQLSDSIALFRIDQRSGELKETGETIAIPSPACIVLNSVGSAESE